MKKILILVVLAALFNNLKLTAQTENFNTWIEVEFAKEFLDKLEFSITPELRLEDQYKVDEYMVQGKLTYEPFSLLDLAGAYRINTEVKNKGNETYYRWAFDAQLKRDFNRFEGSVRGRVTNYTDSSEEDPGMYFRPRASLEYDIKNNKIEPYISYELFRNTTEAEWHKSRFDVGFTRDIGDLHRIGLYYRLHNYFSDKTSVHILGLEYRLKF
jgi:hypothetical protein